MKISVRETPGRESAAVSISDGASADSSLLSPNASWRGETRSRLEPRSGKCEGFFVLYGRFDSGKLGYQIDVKLSVTF